jgi:glycosyltransferase involved in cell wall biosynthesis
MLDSANRKLSILHIVLSIGATNTTYNEHCLPMIDKRDITICTYFRSNITPPKGLALFEGNGSLKGFFQILKTALSAKKYHVIHAHSPHVAVLFLGAMLFGYRKFTAETVVTVHDSYPDFKLRNRLLFIPVFAAFRKVVCCSQASYASFPAVYRWLAGRRLAFVQNGVDIARIDGIAATTPRQAHRNRCFTMVAVSRLVTIKNPSCVIAAFRMSAHSTDLLQYIGDGPLRSSLIAASRTAGLETQVQFTGLIPREKVFEHLLNADLFISTSRGEGLPVSVLEAMACRCPVVLSDIPPHREIANGIDFIPLVAPDDVAGFAREIKKYREMPAQERSALGERCRRLVEERFSLHAMHAGYEQIYEGIANEEFTA